MFLAFILAKTPNGLQFTGANRDAMKQGSWSTVKQRLASGATASWGALSFRRFPLSRQVCHERCDGAKEWSTLREFRCVDYSTKPGRIRTKLRAQPK
jgi:hypothetical protein